MRVTIQSINFDADRKLLEFIHKKVEKLKQFNPAIVDVMVYLRLEKSKDGQNKLVEIKTSVPSGEFMVKQRGRRFEEATDLALDQAKRQLKDAKEKALAY
ncbi:MAG: HPF/RaiA family ribosome-associated protein [Bacteroidia bacterium]|nr:HPF/RaiA family ribosome-associated protein [Bacteroidia bacterium]MDW8333323.1 HPF/RaiA family ribosome-associated protein [Bacteroidia bacterium]